MSTRAGRAAMVQRAQKNLLKLLDHSEKSGSSPAQLQRVYLQRLQEWHPDKQKTKKDSKAFRDIVEAWRTYQDLLKGVGSSSITNRSSAEVTTDFTRFGVGCSFSDSEQERKERNAIMEQAGKGWLPDGVLGEAVATNNGASEIQFSSPPSWGHVSYNTSRSDADWEAVEKIPTSSQSQKPTLVHASFLSAMKRKGMW